MPSGTKLQTARNPRKCFCIIAGLLILQTLIILAVVLTVTRIKTPKIRLKSITVEKVTSNSTTSPSLNLALNALVTIKNPNFGHFDFSDSTMLVVYRGNTVGTAVIPGGRSGIRSTKKLNVTVEVAADAKKDKSLGDDLRSGRFTVSGQATVSGRVHVFEVIKKKKTAKMNCTMDVNTRARIVENLKCK